MNKNNTSNLIEEMKLILRDKTPSLTVESLVFGENNDPMADVDQLPPKADLTQMQQASPKAQQQMDTTPFKSEEDDKVAQNLSQVDAEIKPIIDKIRVLSLQGISKLANNPTSSSYQLLKKIWQTVDKAAEDANKAEKQPQQTV